MQRSLTDPDARGGQRRPPLLRLLVLALPLLVSSIGAPPPPVAAGDELQDAIAQQKALERKIATQRRQVARLNATQAALRTEIAHTTGALRDVHADLTAVRKRITALGAEIRRVRAVYVDLVAQIEQLNDELRRIEAQETRKRVELAQRKELLASRIREAYDAERTSLLETLLSGDSFADVLAEMSWYIDVGQQDKALAQQIERDQRVLATLHATALATRTQTEALRRETAAQKAELDARLRDLKTAQAELKKLEREVARQLAAQKAAYAQLARNKAALARAIRMNLAAERRLKARVARIVAEQRRLGNIPSIYNGTLEWPMIGRISQEFGCTGFGWEPPLGGCPHFHRGIDIVAPYGTPVKAAGSGRIVYIGWNWADGADPAWVVIIAHSENLQTWYGHLQPAYPGGIRTGSWVEKGQVIGYEGNTGHSTGPHLHWAVELNGQFVNPRLFV
ncbi:MAG TPA: peptidoglycan DD-metalloendopeptidase family protein [Candidatus Limnocylindrales bacterium]|nr:peptidoglycan DD-metalloendopeptidase family protein [Candidatus Limnocylindrales bacterium]